MATFTAILAKLLAVIPFSTSLLCALESQLPPDSITREQQVDVISRGVHVALGSDELKRQGLVTDARLYDTAIMMIVSGAIQLYGSLKSN